MAKYLVTGGAGFIGSHITEELIKRGEEVRVLDNFLTGKKENLAPFLADIDLIEGDIRDYTHCQKSVKGIDYVLHQAALPSVPRSVSDPIFSNEINITGTLNMLTAAKEEGNKSFVFASSSSVYGDDQRLPKKEGNEGNPLSPYALGKLTGEHYCRIFSKLYGFNTVSLRYFNIFGPRQDPFSQYAAAIPNFVTKILENENPIIYGDGEQSRDFTFVSNVVEANLLASQAQNVSGEAFNIACGARITVNDLISEIKTILGKEIPSNFSDPRQGDVRHSHADISKAQENLNYQPLIPFSEGLKKTVSWYEDPA
ncbi:MAG: SDR family oxidoreductase [Candidatus Aminicenantes bacterium]|nr:SDR family oxidoreductase [Candidatus Aminicenantes bacterium]